MTARPARASVDAILSAAEIPSSKWGAARTAGLSDVERTLYRWILRRFATHGRPNRAQTREALERLGLEADDVFGTLAREDLVHLDREGEIRVAYPFSGHPTAHRVRLPSGHEAYAMCAIDALGIAPMLGQPIEIVSRDPQTGAEICAQLGPDGEGAWQPESAVVGAGALDSEGDACQGCCPVLNFFASTESAGRWLEEHPAVRGLAVSMPEAIASGRVVFSGVLEQ